MNEQPEIIIWICQPTLIAKILFAKSGNEKKNHMPKFQLIKFHVPKVLYVEIPIVQMHYTH